MLIIHPSKRLLWKKWLSLLSDYNLKAMMKKGVLISICLMTALGMFAKGYVSRQLMDFGWQFVQNGKSVNVDLPHDWDIHAGPASGKGATDTGGGWYPGGIGEYRKTFATPEGEVVKLLFEGVYQRAEVFINCQKAVQQGYGYTPFTVDITEFCKFLGYLCTGCTGIA